MDGLALFAPGKIFASDCFHKSHLNGSYSDRIEIPLKKFLRDELPSSVTLKVYLENAAEFVF